MNTSSLKTSALLGLAIVAFIPSAGAVSWTADDLFLGFHQSGNSTKEYIIDLGQASTFRDATSAFSLTINATSFASDMSSAFGSTWRTAGTVSWGVLGTTQNFNNRPAPDNIIRLLYVSEPAGSISDPTTLPTSDQSGAANDISTFKNYWLTGTAGGVTNSAILDPTGSNSWTALMSSFGSSNLFPVESLLTGPLDLLRLPQAGAGQAATNEGKFTYNSGSDTVTFLPTPEPTSSALLCFALVSLGMRRYRRSDSVAR